MKTPRTRNPRSEKAHQCDVFRKSCAVAGIDTPPSCGPAVRDLLIGLRSSPLLLRSEKNGHYHRATPTEKPLIGMAIKAGFARFVPDEKLYAITPRGETWLNELEVNGLLGEKQKAEMLKAEMKEAA